MKAAKTEGTIDDYIAGFAPGVREKLEKIRATIADAAPGAEQSISYRIPAFKLNGPLLYFAAFKNHIGMYPMTAGTKAKFAKELSGYEQGTGTVRFPHDRPIPYGLISRIAGFRVKENAAAAKRKSSPTTRKPARRPVKA